MAFALSTITQLSIAQLRITYTEVPLAHSSTNVYDALNKLNYSITGPGANSITDVESVSGDPKSFDLTLNTSITSGDWTVTVSNVTKAIGTALSTPTSLAFTAINLTGFVSVAQGAVTDSAEAILRKHLNPALKGPGWDAFIAALATGDEYIRELAKQVFDQLFTSTASGKYLERKAAEDGFIKPAHIGISDDVFRKLAISVGAEKLTLQSFLQVLEVYYGPDAVRATMDSAEETFSINENDDLIIDIDGTQLSVVFHTNDFQDTSAAKAIEVALAITRAFERAKLQAYAVAILDVLTQNYFIRIYSGALGLRGAIRILGGKAQNVLNFPNLLATTQDVDTQWSVDIPSTLPGLVANRARYTYTGGTNPINPSLQLVREGDYANIYGSPFSSTNRGAFLIVNVTTTYFEVENLTATFQGTVLQLAANDILFFRPERQTLNSKPRVALAAFPSSNEAEVILAATTQAVSRTINEAAYIQNNDAINTFLNKVTTITIEDIGGGQKLITTSTDHGLEIGDSFLLAPGSLPDSLVSQPYTVSDAPSSTEITINYDPEDWVDNSDRLFIYPCYRSDTGVVTFKTSSDHGLATDDWVILDNFESDTDTADAEDLRLAGLFGKMSSLFAGTILGGLVKLDSETAFYCGGTPDGDLGASDCALFDSTTEQWTVAASLNTARFGHTSTVLNNGRVLVVGGITDTMIGPITSCEIYDPDMDIWIPVQDVGTARSYHTATLLNNGKVLVSGGGTTVNEIYDPDAGMWSTAAASSSSKEFATMTKLNDGRVLVAGGLVGGITIVNTASIYTPQNDTWTATANMNVARKYHAAALLQLGTSR